MVNADDSPSAVRSGLACDVAVDGEGKARERRRRVLVVGSEADTRQQLAARVALGQRKQLPVPQGWSHPAF